jgi:DNA-binding LacI/PurR family transcriptional regulator
MVKLPDAADAGRVAPGRATMRDVAERAGVSTQTVSNYLNERHRTRSATRERIDRAIRELSYRPNASARSLRSQRSRSIVLAMEDPNRLGLHDPLHLEFLHGAATAVHAAGYTLMVEVTPSGDAGEAALKLVREGRVDGVVLSVGELSAEYRASIDAIAHTQTPVVLLQQHTAIQGVHSVSATDERGAADAVAHLVSLGHERIAFLGAEPEWPGPHRRRLGVQGACEEAGVSLQQWTADAYTVEAARRAVTERLRAPDAPTGIVTANDIVALGVVQQAGDLGLHVPDDVSVIGFNDFDFASWVRPAITTVRLPGAQMAARAIGLVIGESREARAAEAVAFEVELVVRETTGRAPDPARR